MRIAETVIAGCAAAAIFSGNVVAKDAEAKWERCASSTYTAHAVAGTPTLQAEGTVPTGGWKEKLEISPEMIQPPRYQLLCLKPTGIVTQVITPFTATLALPKSTADGQVLQIYDASGLQSATYRAK
jgi:hypothetical protein